MHCAPIPHHRVLHHRVPHHTTESYTTPQYTTPQCTTPQSPTPHHTPAPLRQETEPCVCAQMTEMAPYPTIPVLALYYPSTIPLLSLYYPCTISLISLYWPCTIPVLSLYCPCTAPALPPWCMFVPPLLSYHRQMLLRSSPVSSYRAPSHPWLPCTVMPTQPSWPPQ